MKFGGGGGGGGEEEEWGGWRGKGLWIVIIELFAAGQDATESRRREGGVLVLSVGWLTPDKVS